MPLIKALKAAVSSAPLALIAFTFGALPVCAALEGKIVFGSSRDGNPEIYIMNADGTNQTRLTTDISLDTNPVFSPDGSKIAFQTTRDGNHEIYLMNSDGSNQVNLTNNAADDVTPFFSPDGSKIYFTSNRPSGGSNIYVMNIDGSGVTSVTTDGHNNIGPKMNKDGNKIVFTSERVGLSRVFAMDADGSNQTQVTTNTRIDITPSFNPSGTKVLFATAPISYWQISTIDLTGANQLNLTNNETKWNDYFPCYSPDGSHIVFTSNRDGNYEIYVMNADGSGATRITNNSFTDERPNWWMATTPKISVNNLRSLPEGSASSPGSVTFDITLSAASPQSVTVNYQTHDGTNNPAIAGTDYVSKKGKITFAPGETNKRVTISFLGDSTVELNETFFFDLSAATNATIADSRGVGQINNDDGPGIIVDNAPAVNEPANGTVLQFFTVHLSSASTDTISVSYATADVTATAGNDYTAASGVLTFAPGQTSQTVIVQVNSDALSEPSETYKVVLSKVIYAYIADGTGVGIIRNNAAVQGFRDDEPS